MMNARLLPFGLALIVVAVAGALVTEGTLPGGAGWPDHPRSHGSMMWPGQDGSDAGSPLAGANAVALDADEFTFSPMTITVDEDTPVNLTIVNSGALIHDLSVPELGFRIVAYPGERATGGLVPDRPGSYPFECSIAGHAQAGMTGTLLVRAVA